MRSFCLLAAVLLCACEAPVVGNWESDEELGNGQRNELEITSDNTGNATVFATSCVECTDWVEFKFDVDWQEDATEFDIDMKCEEGACNGDESNNFLMQCEVIEEDDGNEKMDCRGAGNFANYPFDWQREE